MKSLDNLAFFYILDKRIWKENLCTNRAFATLSLLMVAVLGAILSGGEILNSWFGWDTEVEAFPILALCIIIYGYNVGESILALGRPLTVLGRSLLFLLAGVVAVGLGMLLSAIVIVVCALVVGLLLLALVFTLLAGGSGSSGGGKRKWRLDDGTEVEESSGLLGEKYYRGNDGKNYEKGSGDTFTER